MNPRPKARVSALGDFIDGLSEPDYRRASSALAEAHQAEAANDRRAIRHALETARDALPEIPAATWDRLLRAYGPKPPKAPKGRAWVSTPEPSGHASSSARMANRHPFRPVSQEPEDWVTGAEWRERERPEEALREFDFDLCIWVKVPVVVHAPAPPWNVVRPLCDGSGVWWEIRDDATPQGSGYALWWIEAATWADALAEKKRLCRAYGWKPTHARLYEAEGRGGPF